MARKADIQNTGMVNGSQEDFQRNYAEISRQEAIKMRATGNPMDIPFAWAHEGNAKAAEATADALATDRINKETQSRRNKK